MRTPLLLAIAASMLLVVLIYRVMRPTSPVMPTPLKWTVMAFGPPMGKADLWQPQWMTGRSQTTIVHAFVCALLYAWQFRRAWHRIEIRRTLPMLAVAMPDGVKELP